MDSKGNKFWGSFVVRNSRGVIIDRGEIYCPKGTFPEQLMIRVISRYGKKCGIKFIPGVPCMKAE